MTRWMALLVAIALLAACSAEAEVTTPSVEGAGGTDARADTPDERIEAPQVQEAGEAGFSVLAALEEIPASAAEDVGSLLQVSAADLVEAGEQAGLTPPTDPTSADELLAFMGPLTGISRDGDPLRLFVPYPQMFVDRAPTQLVEFRAEVGFTPGEVTSFVALESPPARFIVAGGVSLPDGLPESVPGVRTIGEGEDFESVLDSRTAARPLGRPLRVAEQDGRVAISLATTPIIDWMTGPTAGTLADHPTLAPLATRLDEEDVVSSVMIAFEDDTDAYRGVGLGWSVDDAGSRGVIVFTYDSVGNAEFQLGLVEEAFAGDSLTTRQPVADLVTLESTEVRGSEVVATVRFPETSFPSRIWQMMLNRDVPFTAESGG